MARLRLSLACWDYDRTRALADGSVRPEGIDLNYLDLLRRGDVLPHAAQPRVRRRGDVAVLVLRVAGARGSPPFIAIPVFPSRFFRHSCIFVSAKSGIREPKDLVGKRIGVPEYQMTAPVWIRGILQDEYGVDPASVRVLDGRRGGAGARREARARPAGEIQGEADRPAADALAHDRRRRDRRHAHRAHALDLPQPAGNGEAPVRGLRRGREGVLPQDEDLPDHAHGRDPPRALRGEPLDRAVARQGLRAGASSGSTRTCTRASALTTMLPWQIGARRGGARADMGEDWWPYGFEPNRHVLDTFLRYHHEQGLSKRRLQPEELFAPETLSSFRI